MSTPQTTPQVDQLRRELHREKYRAKHRHIQGGALSVLFILAASVILAATLLLPVLRIYGSAMEPTLRPGDVVVILKGAKVGPQDMAAVSVGGELVVRRCIAGPGQWVDVDRDGNIFVDGTMLDEPYVSRKMLGDWGLTFPLEVPEGSCFFISDNREHAQDPGPSYAGCCPQEDVAGRIWLRIWPLDSTGSLL